MTLDEARLMTNVNARASRMFEDGYRARWIGPDLLAVRKDKGTVLERLGQRSRVRLCAFSGCKGVGPSAQKEGLRF